MANNDKGILTCGLKCQKCAGQFNYVKCAKIRSGQYQKGINMEPEKMLKEDNKIKYSEEIEIYDEYKKLLSISTETLEKMAYRDQAYALRTKNLKERYENFNRSKKILKVIEIIRYLQEKQKEIENE